MTQQSLIAESPVARRVEFVVPGTPVAKGRPRFARQGAHVRTFTPEATERYENLVKMAARAAMRSAEPYPGPIRLIVNIGVPIPASWSQKRQLAAAAGEIGATKKPDADNVVKALKDGMNGVVYVDDGQVVDLWVSKRYARTPGVRIEAIELNLQRA
ncbi:RusA family crossover junction endodeoxyribonuclease [Burkholderia glumae]|uniref:RusA family crossover junction endodeoxyribonuclease n=1 Tax=Burkholderia glumae TaxID=337 RepID=A0ABY5BGD2_BURGL|nr:RusA family crossover junction endodeoxyribonuclease [Burkholderia glumae]ACR28690.1 Endodeoxyribonuclease RusA [Burkholderia glumae BGR1]MCQ0032565.1 RusA family crossover junction endodeoxyribonuclease [Burkholderia glumae]MCQ0035797.1 RusA family crossover junction endodeoxyribonuclease [Burkholderia glumae]PJO24894.1 RusA family crossover junction endodeoxyribonuclease [Burkholderia glumae AU6208]RQZ76411.1 RusA family crossover junction endodeoxyribonuclease [Burkholderia glumae]